MLCSAFLLTPPPFIYSFGFQLQIRLITYLLRFGALFVASARRGSARSDLFGSLGSSSYLWRSGASERRLARAGARWRLGRVELGKRIEWISVGKQQQQQRAGFSVTCLTPFLLSLLSLPPGITVFVIVVRWAPKLNKLRLLHTCLSSVVFCLCLPIAATSLARPTAVCVSFCPICPLFLLIWRVRLCVVGHFDWPDLDKAKGKAESKKN